ncbi:MAG TPA: family 16 glycoside hydrolase [Candidatus Limnocylindria bacterium]|nr:family 16 glycoside hydrolase [Candidatus Limnocylindria bacterium]
MKNSDGTHGAAVSPGHIVGGGHYSLHVPLDDSGLVWLAQDEEQQRLAAIRFFPPEIRDDPHACASLKSRIELAAAVQHESICRVLEWYESPGVETFIATEYVEGKPMLEASGGAVRRGIPWESLSTTVASIARGLDALHPAGVVHHGLKPENILLSADHRVRLVNTVVAGVLMNPLFVPSALNDPAVLRCCSPQQLAGQEPSTADDFYSFGATLFELLTGAPVFSDANSIFQDIQSTPAPALRERLPEWPNSHAVPDVVIDFITACLNKDASARPQSFACLLSGQEQPAPIDSTPLPPERETVAPLLDLHTAEVVADSPSRTELELIQHARPVRPRSKTPWVIAALFLLLASAAAGWVFLDRQNQEKERIAAIAAEEVRQREAAETQRREAEEKLQRAIAARLKSEESARRAEEAARLAALAQEKQLLEAEAQARLDRERLAATQKANAEPQIKKPAPAPLPSADTDGFVAMFNGRDFTDWVGDTNHWSVRDSFITAQSKADDEKQRHLLVWQKGSVSDFEMQFSYRFRLLRGNKHPNGGVNYRLTGQTNLTCYQFDLVTNPKDNGSVNDDKRRSRLAGYGDSVTATSSNKHELIERLGDTNTLSAVRPEDWTRCVIIAKGNRLTHYINGELAADVTDGSKSKRHTAGLIALELYTRNTNNCATFMQFKDLKLKRLDGAGGNDPLVSKNP